MKKYRIIVLCGSLVFLLNSCLVGTAVGVAGAAVGTAVEVVKLPFKLVGGIINMISGSNRDKEIEKVGMSKYEKKVSDILGRKKETVNFGNFNLYSYKDLEFREMKSSVKEKPMQLVDKKSNIKFSFTVTLIDSGDINSKISELESTEGVRLVSTRQVNGMNVREYTMTVNNKKEKKIETYELISYERNGELLLYQYLVSNDDFYNVEEVLFKNLVTNTF